VATGGNSETEDNARTSKARGPFAALKSIWKARQDHLENEDPFIQVQCPLTKLLHR